MFGVKLTARIPLLLLAVFFICAGAANAQGPAGGRIEPPRDTARETEAKHSLGVARWYLTKRKAYEGARDRLQEILDTYPEFSRIDEVMFLLGEAHLKLGKTGEASEFYNKLVEKYPGSEFVRKARERLEETGAAGKGGQKEGGAKQQSTR
ncbi:MAG TPA: tetratricopeptide repeat protein [Blastocatellia bacterium]|nr:tetratricopeptide repeat protein [Blastocatellia bacterium]